MLIRHRPPPLRCLLRYAYTTSRATGPPPRVDASTPAPHVGTRQAPQTLSSGADRASGTIRSTRAVSEPGKVLNPRQLYDHLSGFVVGQEHAKKVLAVAVFNHYRRVATLVEPPPPPESNEPASMPSTISPATPASIEGLTPPAPSSSEPPAAAPGFPSPPSTSPIKSQTKPPPSAPLQFDAAQPSSVVHEKSNVLLIGPTGSGKSLLARTLAKSLNVPFVGVEATGLTMAGYVGEDVETCIHRLLLAADHSVERAGSGIIFIDECDKLARSGSASVSKDVSGEGVQQALLKILEGTVVGVPVKDGGASKGGRRGMGMGGAGSGDEVLFVDTTNILFILAGAFVGLDKIIAKRVGLSEPTPPLTGSSDESSPSTQEDPLSLVEPSDLSSFGLIPEFIGRLPVVATLRALTEDDLLRVLTEPKNSLVSQYEQLFLMSGVECRFTTPALRAIAKKAVAKGTGARGLRGIMEKVLLDAMFAAPESSIRYVLVVQECIEDKAPVRFYSRGQKHVFEIEHASEEEADLARAREQVQAAEAERGVQGGVE